PRFGRRFWELPDLLDGWVYQQSTVRSTQLYGGRESVLFWENGSGVMTRICQEGATFRGQSAWRKPGVVVSQMRSLPVTIYTGEHFDNNCAVVLPFEASYQPAVWAFCSSGRFHDEVRRIDKNVKVTNSTLVKIPFDL